MFVLLLFAFGCVFAAGEDFGKFVLCGGAHSGQYYNVPTINCSLVDTVSQVDHVMVQIFTPTKNMEIARGFSCFRKMRVICGKVTLTGEQITLSDDSSTIPATANECRKARDQVLSDRIQKWFWRTKPLVKLADRLWGTNATLRMEWHYLKRGCSKVENFYVLEGELATMDGVALESSLGDTGNCQVANGTCETAESTQVWNPQDLKTSCRFEAKEGEHLGLMSTSSTSGQSNVIVESLNAAFNLGPQLSKRNLPAHLACLPEGTRLTPQGPALLIRNVKTSVTKQVARMFDSNGRYALMDKKDDTDELPDHINSWANRAMNLSFFDAPPNALNSQMQFLSIVLDQAVLGSFFSLWRTICETTRHQVDIAHQLLQIDATVGARALFGNDSIQATFRGEALVVSACDLVEPTKLYYNGSVGDTCFGYTPAEYDGQLFFVVPGTRELVTNAPEVPCHEGVGAIYKSKGGWVDEHGSVRVQDVPLPMVYRYQWGLPIFHAPPIYNWHDSQVQQRLGLLKSYMFKTSRADKIIQRFDKVEHGQTQVAPGHILSKFSEPVTNFLGEHVENVLSHVGKIVGDMFKHILGGPLEVFLISVAVLAALFFFGYVISKCHARRKDRKRRRRAFRGWEGEYEPANSQPPVKQRKAPTPYYWSQ